MIDTIFCPQCGELILDQASCSTCGWRRPVVQERLGTGVWEVDVGHRLAVEPPAYPCIAQEYCCLVAEDGTVVALDLQSGKPAWERLLPSGSTAHAVATDGQHLFIGCEDTRTIPEGGKALLALDSLDGKDLWQYPTQAHSLSAATVAGGTVYFTGSDGLIRAVDAAAGTMLWEIPHAPWGPAAPAAAGQFVCAGGQGGMLTMYAAATGEQRWQFTAGGWFAAQPCIAGRSIYALCWDGYLYALDVDSGHLRWKYKGERGSGIISPPVTANERVLIGSRVFGQAMGERNTGYAVLALSAADGREQWRFYTTGRVVAPPLAVDDTVLFGADDGAFYAVDATSGRERWWKQAHGRIVTQPLISGDVVYFASRAGTAYALCWRTPAVEQVLPPSAHIFRGEYAKAAAAYARKGELDTAAAIYAERLVQPREAALLYDRAGQPDKAAALWERVGELRYARDRYQQAGDRVALARVLEQLGEPIHAAQLYLELGKFEPAARLYEQAGDRVKAAEAYEGAAQRLAAQQRPAVDKVAQLYEQAAQLYLSDEVSDEERAAACSKQVRRYRRLPEIVVDGRAEQVFVELEWNTLKLHVSNIGYGLARNVRIDVRGAFEVEQGSSSLNIPAGHTADLDIFLRPHREQFGPKVPLRIDVAYKDQRGAGYTLTQRIPLHVTQHGASVDRSTPLAISMREDPLPPPSDTADTAATGAAKRSPPPVVPPSRSQDLPLTLRFICKGDATWINWEADVIGRRDSTFHSPYDAAILPLVIKALDAVQFPSHPQGGPRFSAREQASLATRGLWAGDRVVADIHRRVGKELFGALVGDAMAERALQTARDYATTQGLPLRYLLRFPPEAIELAALPWELLWGRRGPLLLSRGVAAACVRYLDLDQALPPPAQVGSTLRVLVIAPNARIRADVRAEEQTVLAAAWAELVQARVVEIEELNPATPGAFVDRIQAGPPVDIVHFYGHGRYKDSQGELLFDDPSGGEYWLGANRLAILPPSTRLVLLHACQSSTISESGLLTGVAPALSAAGVPAVVAMQLTVRIPAATRFAGIVYRSLARGDSVQHAVSLARQALYVEERDGVSWYVPTVTIRARDTGPMYLVQPREKA